MAEPDTFEVFHGEDAGSLPVEVCRPSAGSVFRIGRATDPLAPSYATPAEELKPHVGNRFDTAEFGVIYFGSTPECCYGETLARFRPDPKLAALVVEDWPHSFMKPGQIPRDWRDRRTLVATSIDQDEVFLDVESLVTRESLRQILALGLSSLGYTELDVPTIRGADRRVTRLISKWAFNLTNPDDGTAVFAGLRYVSRLNSEWECWAAFDDILINESRGCLIVADDPALLKVCDVFKLHVH